MTGLIYPFVQRATPTPVRDVAPASDPFPVRVGGPNPVAEWANWCRWLGETTAHQALDQDGAA